LPTVLASAATVLVVAGYMAAWVVHGLRGGGVDIRLAAVLWLALAAAVSRLWHRRGPQRAAMVLVAAVGGVAWSHVYVGFPTLWGHDSLVLEIALWSTPVVLAAVGGGLLGARPAMGAAVIVLLALAAVFPLQVLVISHSLAEGRSAYPYPSLVPALILLMVEMVVAAVGASVLARRRRRG
jgi:hypothetical protein